MKKQIISLSIFSVLFLNTQAKEKQALSFIENKGQVSDQNHNPRPDVLYSGTDGGMTYHIKNSGVSYQLMRVDTWKNIPSKKEKVADQNTIYRIDLNWLGTNSNFTRSTDEVLPGISNFYNAVCSDGAINVKSYTGVWLNNIYNNINLHYYSGKSGLKYDYIVKAGADYKQIKFQVTGAEIIPQPDGSLKLNTPLGTIIEGAPIAFQNGQALKTKWIVQNNVLSFEVENYNPQLELILDPAVRAWGTYYGGGLGNEEGNYVSTDATGNVYMAGYTKLSGGTTIATAGSHQTIIGGLDDAFIVKFNSSGVRQWGTYYGDVSDDYGNACAVDASGNVYLAGETAFGSGTVIATITGHQSTWAGNTDCFLAKFNSSGVRQWATFYGGAIDEWPKGCAVDASGNVYMSGSTDSNGGTAIATVGSHLSTYAGNTDAFLVKFNSAGVRQWGTYYGGAQQEEGHQCAVDASANVYLSGVTDTPSGTGIATALSHQPTFMGGTDGFLAKFNSAGVRQWGTYYGGLSWEVAYSCATDPSGNVYLSGWTDLNTGTLVATVGSHQQNNAGGYDAYLVKFNTSGVRQWGTYYGGVGSDYGGYCTTDGLGNVYLAGQSANVTGTVLATAGSHQVTQGGGGDSYIAQFNNSGVRQWGTYYGGNSTEAALGCAGDALGNVYLTGATGSSSGTVIASVGSHQSTFGGGSFFDAFLVRFNTCAAATASLSSQTNVLCNGNSTGAATISASGGGPFTYTWLPAGGNATSATNLVAGNYSCVATNTCGANATVTLSITQPPAINISINSPSICSGNTSTVLASVTGGTGTITYTWSVGGNTNSLVVTPSVTTIYSLTVTDGNSCTSTSNSTVTVNPNPTITVNSGTICSGGSFTISPSGASTYTFTGGGPVVTPTANASYTVTGTSTLGCAGNSVVSSVTVNPIPSVSVSTSNTLICVGQAAVLTATGASTYSWNTGPTTNTIVVSPTVTTNYTVTGTDANGCSADLVFSQAVSPCTGISVLNSSNSSILVYPNPGSGLFYVKSTEYANSEIEVYNSIGQLILKQDLSSEVTSLNLTTYASGIYTLRVKTNNSSLQLFKLVKE